MSVADTIRRRRAIFPKTYIPGEPVERELIEQLLEAANWAPTHRLTEPWRFRVFYSRESRERLGDYFSEFYRRHTPADVFSEEKYARQGFNPRQSVCAIAIIMQRDPEQRVPEFEEIASVAMAVQNMWLLCTELGLGCYWSTPPAILAADEFLELQPGQRCLGLFYIGRHNLPEIPGKRTPVSEKTVWL